MWLSDWCWNVVGEERDCHSGVHGRYAATHIQGQPATAHPPDYRNAAMDGCVVWRYTYDHNFIWTVLAAFIKFNIDFGHWSTYK